MTAASRHAAPTAEETPRGHLVTFTDGREVEFGTTGGGGTDGPHPGVVAWTHGMPDAEAVLRARGYLDDPPGAGRAGPWELAEHSLGGVVGPVRRVWADRRAVGDGSPRWVESDRPGEGLSAATATGLKP